MCIFIVPIFNSFLMLLHRASIFQMLSSLPWMCLIVFFMNEIIYSYEKSTNDWSDRVFQAPHVYTGDILYMFLQCEQLVCRKCATMFSTLLQVVSLQCPLFTVKPAWHSLMDRSLIETLVCLKSMKLVHLMHLVSF